MCHLYVDNSSSTVGNMYKMWKAYVFVKGNRLVTQNAHMSQYVPGVTISLHVSRVSMDTPVEML